MLFTKRRSRFSPDAIYLVVIQKRDEYLTSLGFFHHKGREIGFLAYADHISEIRTIKVKRSEAFFVPRMSHVVQWYIRRAYKKLRCHECRKTRRFSLLRGIRWFLLCHIHGYWMGPLGL